MSPRVRVESKKFLKYFPKGVKYLKGGVASGFKHVEAEDRPPVLLRLKGRGNNVSLTAGAPTSCLA